MADHRMPTLGIKEETERTFLTQAEMLAAAEERGRLAGLASSNKVEYLRGLKDAAGIARSYRPNVPGQRQDELDLVTQIAAAIEARAANLLREG